MPAKSSSLAEGQSSKESNKFNLRIIGKATYLHLVIILGIAVLIAVAIYAYLWFGQNRMVNENKGVGAGQSNDLDKKYAQIQIQAEQDQQRKNDIDTINSALKSFYLKEKKAPESLKGLVPDYLKKLPTDPVTKKEYGYNLSKDKNSWQVSAILSDGAKFEVKGP